VSAEPGAGQTEKARYQLREVNTGVFAYVPKQGMEQGEPFHMLCANCYERGEKSILQATQELSGVEYMYALAARQN
jgi:hypothetical protein